MTCDGGWRPPRGDWHGRTRRGSSWTRCWSWRSDRNSSRFRVPGSGFVFGVRVRVRGSRFGVRGSRTVAVELLEAQPPRTHEPRTSNLEPEHRTRTRNLEPGTWNRLGSPS